MEINLNETLPKVVWDSRDCLLNFEKVLGEKINEFYTMAKNHLPFKDEFYHCGESGIITYFLRDILGKINISSNEICHLSITSPTSLEFIISCYLENAKKNINIHISRDNKEFNQFEVNYNNTNYKYKINKYTKNNENNIKLYNIRKCFLSGKFLDCSISDNRVKIRPGYTKYNAMSRRNNIFYTFTLDIFYDEKAIKLFYNEKIINLLTNLKTFEFEIIDVYKQLMNIFKEENLTFTDFSLINENVEEYYSSLTLEYLYFRNEKLYMAKIKKGDATYKINNDGTWEYTSPTLNVKLGNITNYLLGEDWNMQVLENEIQNIRPFFNIDFEEKSMTKQLKKENNSEK